LHISQQLFTITPLNISNRDVWEITPIPFITYYLVMGKTTSSI